MIDRLNIAWGFREPRFLLMIMFLRAGPGVLKEVEFVGRLLVTRRAALHSSLRSHAIRWLQL